MKSTLSLFGVSLMFIVHFLGAEPLSSKDLQSAKKIINNLCIACHGADGNSAISVNPKLAGQHAAYITKQLMNFKSGKRDNAVMAGMVATLTEQDMINLGTYFSNQKITLSMAKENGIDSKLQDSYHNNITAGWVDPLYNHNERGLFVPQADILKAKQILINNFKMKFE